MATLIEDRREQAARYKARGIILREKGTKGLTPSQIAEFELWAQFAGNGEFEEGLSDEKLQSLSNQRIHGWQENFIAGRQPFEPHFLFLKWDNKARRYIGEGIQTARGMRTIEMTPPGLIRVESRIEAPAALPVYG